MSEARPEPSAFVHSSTSYQDIFSIRIQNAPAFRQRMVGNVVQNHVVTLIAFGEILFSVINNMICTERSDQVQISCTANAGHICAHGFSYLHRERAYTSRRTVNQDFLPGLDLSFVANAL